MVNRDVLGDAGLVRIVTERKSAATIAGDALCDRLQADLAVAAQQVGAVHLGSPVAAWAVYREHPRAEGAKRIVFGSKRMSR